MPAPRLSFWERDTLQTPVDVAIIGGGIVGLTAALVAKRRYPARRVRVYEREVLSTGAGSRNAGFSCFGSLSELCADLATRPEREVLDLIAQRWTGLRRLRALLGDAALRYEARGGYELFLPEDEASYRRCREALPWLNDRLKPIIGTAVYRHADDRADELGLRGAAHLIHNAYEGLLHPGHLIGGLRRRATALGIELQYGVALESFDSTRAGVTLHLSDQLTVAAGQLLLATNAFTAALLPGLAVQPARNQVLLTAPLPGLRLRGGFHYRDGYVYFRHVGNRLLIGGGRHLDPGGETTTAFGDAAVIQAYLEHFLRTHLTGTPAPIAQRWSGILGIGPQKSPIVRTVAPRVHVGVRLGGMGVAIGSETGRQLAALI